MRVQNEGQHQYLVSPTGLDPTTERLESTYDQFLQLRDTLIYSEKKYKGKAWSKLIVWEKEETVEILWKNGFKLSFEPNVAPETTSINYHEWPYVEYTPTEWDFTAWSFLTTHNYTLAKRLQDFWILSCRILKSGNYRIEYKVQVGSSATPIPAGTTKIYAFVIRYKYLNNLLVPWEVSVAPAKDVDPDNQTANRFHIAVWDLQQKPWWATITWSTSWTDPNWSCSVTITLADLYNKITAIWYNDTNLDANDVLAFHVVDQNLNSLDPYLQANSNFFSVKYSDFTIL